MRSRSVTEEARFDLFYRQFNISECLIIVECVERVLWVS